MMDFETKRSAERLLTGDAEQEDRDRVLYFLASSRWTPEKLDEHIKSVHNTLCQSCPERHHGRPTSQKPMDWTAIIKTLLWIIAGLVAILMAKSGVSVPSL